jgi:serine protease inhibitor
MRALVAALLVVVACTAPTAQTATINQSSSIPPATRLGATPQPTPSTVAPQSPVAAIAPIAEIRSSTARNSPGRDRLEGMAALTAAEAEFAFDLYDEITSTESGNVFFSPYSISTALSMALAGARGNTAEEMRSVLRVSEDQAWHDARNRLELALTSQQDRSLPYDGDATPMTLEPTNTIFGQQNYAFRDDFLDLLAADYGAGMQAVDFSADPESARLGINAWVAELTHDRIEELLPVGSITPLARAVLVNAIYFKANWYSKFNPENTRTEPFHLLDGSLSNVEMMHASPETGYSTGANWAAVQLPYWGSTSMVVVVPDEGRFAAVEQKIDAPFLAQVLEGMTEHEVHLSLPRWESEYKASLKPPLKEMGIVDVFEPGRADLSGIADFSQTGEPLFVQDVVHQANITVDEEGTEAAAATAVLVFGVCRCPPPEATLTIDRPFIYVIRDDLTGEILFMGRLLDP